MKRVLVISSAAILAACVQTEPLAPAPEPNNPAAATPVDASPTTDEQQNAEIAPSAEIVPGVYDESVWYLSPGWPGEYPPGFSVLHNGVSLIGRTHMNEVSATHVCPLPQNASYQLWNSERVEIDKLEFVTASQRINITITDEVTVDAPTDDDWNNSLELKSGDTVTYLRYVAEGWAVMEHNSVEYQIEENALNGVSDIDTAFANAEDDRLWVRVTCADENQTRAWLNFDEVIQTEGIVVTPITGYGESRDLTEEDRIAAVEETKFYLEELARAATEANQN